jgi:hypothetical protein
LIACTASSLGGSKIASIITRSRNLPRPRISAGLRDVRSSDGASSVLTEGAWPGFGAGHARQGEVISRRAGHGWGAPARDNDVAVRDGICLMSSRLLRVGRWCLVIEERRIPRGCPAPAAAAGAHRHVQSKGADAGGRPPPPEGVLLLGVEGLGLELQTLNTEPKETGGHRPYACAHLHSASTLRPWLLRSACACCQSPMSRGDVTLTSLSATWARRWWRFGCAMWGGSHPSGGSVWAMPRWAAAAVVQALGNATSDGTPKPRRQHWRARHCCEQRSGSHVAYLLGRERSAAQRAP